MADSPLAPGHIARRLRIHGLVQGVFFRGWAVETARSLGISGWVRNRSDSSVEALAVGPAAAVESFIRRCHEGPPHADVERVEVEPAQGIVGPGFVQKPSV